MGSSMIIINQDKLNKLNNEKRIKELQTLLNDSDFRMSKDYFEQMSAQDQEKWTKQRKSWRDEIRNLNANQIN
jgi:coenzyme F420-reducing hydrogenase delta subunit